MLANLSESLAAIRKKKINWQTIIGIQIVSIIFTMVLERKLSMLIIKKKRERMGKMWTGPSKEKKKTKEKLKVNNSRE